MRPRSDEDSRSGKTNALEHRSSTTAASCTLETDIQEAMFLLAATTVAVFLPAHRASRADPMIAIANLIK
jgi:hypothetical protein